MNQSSNYTARESGAGADIVHEQLAATMEQTSISASAEPKETPSSVPKSSDSTANATPAHAESSSNHSDRQRESENNFGGSRGSGRGQEGKAKKRKERSRNRRDRNDETKRRRIEKNDGNLPVYATEFSKDEIDKEGRRPKRKVAVLIGYSGSGYKGLQLSDKEKTIEGELFKAFVEAGAISKANADDPKKTSLVRCARTDKGVHAAGNVLSLKLIIEDENIVEKINSHLTSQIRVWGIMRTNGSFSAYQLCDSRIYEYLIPTHCFLPPHPKSYLGRKLDELAAEANDVEGYAARQEEVSTFWTSVEETTIKPLLATMDPSLRAEALRIIFEGGSQTLKAEVQKSKRESAQESSTHPEAPQRTTTPLEQAVRTLKTAYQHARLAYRLSPTRLARIQSVLQSYIGTLNYHNYTIGKGARDPSCKRVMFSFKTAPEPTIINNTEWLSMKVHGQSFMMHQIRKMVSMMALTVRAGTPEERIKESFSLDKWNIPKAPGLGLLLERPVFGSYNKDLRTKGGVDRDPLEFVKFEREMDEFKQREIYERIHREEEEKVLFHGFLASLDNLRSSQLLYLTSVGYEATKRAKEGAEESIEDVEDLEKVLESGDEKEEPADGWIEG